MAESRYYKGFQYRAKKSPGRTGTHYLLLFY